MPGRLENMDLEVLQKMYETQYAELETKLLKGSAWKQVTSLQKKLTQISTIIYNRLSTSDPASYSTRQT